MQKGRSPSEGEATVSKKTLCLILQGVPLKSDATLIPGVTNPPLSLLGDTFIHK